MRCKIYTSLLIVLVLGAILVGGCGPKGDEATTKPEPPVTQVTTSAPPQTTTLPTTPTKPTTSQKPTTSTKPTTSLPQPEFPKLLSAYPEDGAKGLAHNSQLQFRFSVPMDHQSAEGAISVSPAVEFVVEWQESGKLMVVSPADTWQYGTAYTFIIDSTAKSEEGLALEYANEMTFTIEKAPDPPQVSSVSPEDGSFELGTSFSVQITFDAAMDKKATEGALQINPEVEAGISWQDGDTVMVISALGGWKESTLYSFTVISQAKAASGVNMEQDYNFTLSTGPAPESPVIVETVPKEGVKGVEIQSNYIEVTFSQPMDQESVIQSISIEPNIYMISSFTMDWRENDTFLIINFPGNTLEQGQVYEITFSTQAKSAAGVNMEEDFVLTFETNWVC